jgi:hypothetical protein
MIFHFGPRPATSPLKASRSDPMGTAAWCCCMVVLATAAASPAADPAVTAAPYLRGGLFVSPALPVEEEEVTITVRATVEGDVSDDPEAMLTVHSPAGQRVAGQMLTLQRGDGVAEATWKWTGRKNGLYTVHVRLDPNERLDDADRTNNDAQIVLPVLVKGRALHFAWYAEEPDARWVTCVTSANDPAQQKRLAERGIKPLQWQFAGLSWFGAGYYDAEAFAKDPEAYVSGPLVDTFYEMYSGEQPEHAAGWGIDETGGYPGSWHERFSMASMQALVKAGKENPERFIAVWQGGGVRRETAQYYRDGVDLLLLESYAWRAQPQDLGTEDIYQMIRDRLDPFIRGADMIQPAYGNRCHTLIGLDVSEQPENTDLGEFEQVVRFVRRICPEMRGLCYYGHGEGRYGGYGPEPSLEMDKHHKAILATADRLLLDYYIKPCLTLMRESLWAHQMESNQWELTAAVSNIGAIDSGSVTVQFYVDGMQVGSQSADHVPAGPNRNHNRALIKLPVQLDRGPRRFEARIVAAPDSTVLDAVATCERFVP